MASSATPRNPNPFPIVRPDRSSIHPSHLPPPSFFWSTLSVASTLVFIISLCTINSFKSLSYFYTVPTIYILLGLPTRLYPLLFSRLHNPPLPHPLTLMFIERTGSVLRHLLCYYPKEDSLQVVLFYVALTVNAMAITKLIRPWKKGKVFQHLMFAAMVRVFRLCWLHGWCLIGYLYGVMYVSLGVLLFYFDKTEGFW